MIPPVPFFFLKIALAIRGFFLYFHTNCEIICSSSVINTVGSLISIFHFDPLKIVKDFDKRFGSLVTNGPKNSEIYFSIFVCVSKVYLKSASREAD